MIETYNKSFTLVRNQRKKKPVNKAGSFPFLLVISLDVCRYNVNSQIIAN